MKRFAPAINGLRGCALLVAGVFSITQGISYMPAFGEPVIFPHILFGFEPVVPIPTWGGIWIAIGMAALVRAFSKNDSVAWGSTTGIMVIWGLGYIVSWLDTVVNDGEPSRDWLAGITYLSFAVIIALLTAKTARENDD